MSESIVAARTSLVQIPNDDVGVVYREVADFPGYAVGDDGSVWSSFLRMRRPVGRGTICVIGGPWKPLKQHIDRDGYRDVQLYRQDRRRSYHRRVHNLVLETFVGRRPAGFVGCHNNGDVANNALVNLRWDTQLGNIADSVAQGTRCRGDRCHNARLNTEMVMAIRNRGASGTQQRVIAREFGISQATVWAILAGKAWTHVK